MDFSPFSHPRRNTRGLSKRKALRKKMCRGKKGHDFLWQARIVLRKVQRKRPEAHFSAYRCPFCHKYHLGRDRAAELVALIDRISGRAVRRIAAPIPVGAEHSAVGRPDETMMLSGAAAGFSE